MSELHEQILELVRGGLNADGAHHKQWYLEQIAQLLLSPEEYETLANDEDYSWDEGIAP